MKKKIRWIIFLIATLIFSMSILYLNFQFSNNYSKIPYTHSYIKAICNETNFCEDYNIVCKEKELLFMSPTGAVIQQDKNWKDPRKENKNDSLC